MENNNPKKYNFLLEGVNGKAVLLIHGITGTPSEMRYLGKSLNKAGYTVFCDTLPRHCDTLGELKKVTWQEIAQACMEDFKALRQRHDEVFIAGLSMGALMGLHLAYSYPAEVSAVAVLAPTIFYDGWALHKGKIFLNLAWHIPYLRYKIDIREGWPYGLKDEELRESIERFYKDADAHKYSNKVLLFGSPFFPLANLYQHYLFTKLVMRELKSVSAPTIVIHAKEDDMTSLKNARYVYDKISSTRKSLVVLEDSYHMVTIDKEKDKVAAEIIHFFNQL